MTVTKRLEQAVTAGVVPKMWRIRIQGYAKLKECYSIWLSIGVIPFKCIYRRRVPMGERIVLCPRSKPHKDTLVMKAEIKKKKSNFLSKNSKNSFNWLSYTLMIYMYFDLNQ